MAVDQSFITGSSPASLPGQQSIINLLDDIGDVNAPTPTNKFHIVFDTGTQTWILSDTALKSDVAAEATKVTGVDAAGNDEYYGKNAAGTIGFHAIPVPKTNLDSLTDVDLTTPATASKPLLRFDSGSSTFKASDLAAVGGDDNGVFLLNGLTVSESYTIVASTGASSVGPITVAAGKTVTVSAGSRWVVS